MMIRVGKEWADAVVIGYPRMRAGRVRAGTSRRALPPPTSFISSCPTAGAMGDPGNDRIAGMRDQSLNRDSIFLRHGGDLKGVTDHLDYCRDWRHPPYG